MSKKKKRNRNNEPKPSPEPAGPAAVPATAQEVPVRTMKEPTSTSSPYYGCAILLIAVLTFGGSAFWMFIYTPLMQNREIEQFTVNDPPPLPAPAATEADVQVLRGKLETFSSLALKGKPVTLTLTPADLNTLIGLAGEAGIVDYRGMVHFREFHAGAKSIEADIRWKMNHLPLVKAADRFLAGRAVFKPVVENGALELRIESVEVPGKQVSEGFLKQLHNWPWLNAAKLKPEVSAPLAKVSSYDFAVNNSVFILQCRPRTGK